MDSNRAVVPNLRVSPQRGCKKATHCFVLRGRTTKRLGNTVSKDGNDCMSVNDNVKANQQLLFCTGLSMKKEIY